MKCRMNLACTVAVLLLSACPVLGYINLPNPVWPPQPGPFYPGPGYPIPGYPALPKNYFPTQLVVSTGSPLTKLLWCADDSWAKPPQPPGGITNPWTYPQPPVYPRTYYQPVPAPEAKPPQPPGGITNPWTYQPPVYPWPYPSPYQPVPAPDPDDKRVKEHLIRVEAELGANAFPSVEKALTVLRAARTNSLKARATPSWHRPPIKWTRRRSP